MAVLSRIRGGRMANWNKCTAVERDPEKLSVAWVFRGTLVPVSALFENLKDGATVAQFLEWFPGVDGSNVEAVLAHEVESLANAMDSWGYCSTEAPLLPCGVIRSSTRRTQPSRWVGPTFATGTCSTEPNWETTICSSPPTNSCAINRIFQPDN